MRHQNRLSGWQVFTWATLGVAAGLVTGLALGEWVGGVNRPRLRRMATRIRAERRPPALTSAAAARAARAALDADPSLEGMGLDAIIIGRGVVELRGWAQSRAARARAARVALAVPGVESVINRILVRGEDDRGFPADVRTTDQSA
ncbi:MAG TPA: BON domain-containing protein [Gemmatimonadales bacterium]|nr:BON domain-containing protein [Gemmatimonadales bacterium]